MAFPDIPQVAVFDTAFFRDLPAAAATYAIDRERRRGSNRSGGTGFTAPRTSTSPSWWRRCWAGTRRAQARSCCIWATAPRRPRSAAASAVETSMGLTPLEGLVMGTRSGDIDPGVVFHLLRAGGHGRRPGRRRCSTAAPACSGLSGVSDFRDLHKLIEAGDAAARRWRSTCTATGSASTSAPTWPCWAAPTSSRSPPGSARTRRRARGHALGSGRPRHHGRPAAQSVAGAQRPADLHRHVAARP